MTRQSTTSAGHRRSPSNAPDPNGCDRRFTDLRDRYGGILGVGDHRPGPVRSEGFAAQHPVENCKAFRRGRRASGLAGTGRLARMGAERKSGRAGEVGSAQAQHPRADDRSPADRSAPRDEEVEAGQEASTPRAPARMISGAYVYGVRAGAKPGPLILSSMLRDHRQAWRWTSVIAATPG